MRFYIQHFTDKCKAAAIHGGVTFITAVFVWYLIGFWYPGALSELMNSFAVYKIVMGVELVLGPLISLIIFSPDKSRSQLIKDYAVVLLIQLSALIYGLYVVAQSRPAFLVLARDRIEIVKAADIAAKDLKEIKDKYFMPSLFSNTKSICVTMPIDKQGRQELFTSIMSAKDIFRLPKYYRKCESGEWRASAKNLEILEQKIKMANATDAELKTYTQSLANKCGWLPLVTPTNIVSAIVCSEKNAITGYVKFDPSF